MAITAPVTEGTEIKPDVRPMAPRKGRAKVSVGRHHGPAFPGGGRRLARGYAIPQRDDMDGLFLSGRTALCPENRIGWIEPCGFPGGDLGAWRGPHAAHADR